ANARLYVPIDSTAHDLWVLPSIGDHALEIFVSQLRDSLRQLVGLDLGRTLSFALLFFTGDVVPKINLRPQPFHRFASISQRQITVVADLHDALRAHVAVTEFPEGRRVALRPAQRETVAIAATFEMLAGFDPALDGQVVQGAHLASPECAVVFGYTRKPGRYTGGYTPNIRQLETTCNRETQKTRH